MKQENKQERKKNIVEFWQRVLFHNLSIKLLSFAGALLVWLFIINIDDPYKTKSYVVHVDLTNEDALRSVHKVYEVVEGSTATVSVRGKRSVIDNLDAEDIRATADLSELSAVNSVAIKASLKVNTSSDVELECTQVLKVSLEDMETKQVKVTVESDGTPADGYTVGACTAKPNVIEVTGGESVVDRIATVKVILNVNGASESFSKNVEPVAYDKKGNRITSSTLTFETSRIRVRAQMLQNKTIPVKVSVEGQVASGYEFVEANCVPDEIDIAGSTKKLASVSQIEIPIDITGFRDDSAELEQDVEMEEYLPEGITIPEEFQKISVKITVEKLAKKRIKIMTNDILLRNLENGYVGEAYESSGNIDLVVQGRESQIKSLNTDKITAVVDCEALEAGNYELPVSFSGLKDCKVVEDIRVHVNIEEQSTVAPSTEKPTATPESTIEPTQTPKPSEDEDN